MDEGPLSNARPISCSVCPAFQRRHSSLFCNTESPNRLPGLMPHHLWREIYIRWCCIDLLRPPRLSCKCAPRTLNQPASEAIRWEAFESSRFTDLGKTVSRVVEMTNTSALVRKHSKARS